MKEKYLEKNYTIFIYLNDYVVKVEKYNYWSDFPCFFIRNFDNDVNWSLKIAPHQVPMKKPKTQPSDV